MTTDQTLQRKKRRTNYALERDIFEAAKVLIEQHGFSKITLSTLAETAQINPVVFTKRYKDLESFFDKFVRRYDYWISEITELHDFDINQQFYQGVLEDLSKSLNKNKVMQKMLLWELSEENPTTKRTAMMREVNSEQLINTYDDYFKNGNVHDIRATTALLIGGVYYLILHKERSPFCGINFNTGVGQEKLREAIKYITAAIFSYKNQLHEKMDIARNLKKEGVNIQIIAKCLHLDETMVTKL